MELVVVEDDSRLSQFLEKALTREGWLVRVCSSIDEVRDLIQVTSALNYPRMAIFDRMVWGEDSLDILPEFKKKFP